MARGGVISRLDRRFYAAVAAPFAFACVLALGASSAGAGAGVADVFPPPPGAGIVSFPTGVGVNQASGDVFVLEAGCCGESDGGRRMVQFSANGEFVRAWGWGVATGTPQFEICTDTCLTGIEGAGDGQLAASTDSGLPQVAVDQSDGSVYVADNVNNRVQKFGSAGAFLGKFGTFGEGDGAFNAPQGVAVDPVSQDVYVADSGNNRVQRFDSDGNYLSQFGSPGGAEGPLSGPTRVAVDSMGRVYVLDAFNGRLLRFTDTGTFDQVFAEGAYSAPTDLTVDPATDHVYVAASSADFTVQGIFEFDQDGVAADVHAVNSGIGSFPAGMAVHSSTGVIYATSPFNPKRVMVLDDVAAPTATIDPATDVGATIATFNGTVNPQGPPNTRYRFEYSLDGANWTRVPADEDAPVGADTSNAAVSQTATGLVPNTEYRVRLVATKDFNPAAAATTAEVEFTTDAVPAGAGAWGGQRRRHRSMARR